MLAAIAMITLTYHLVDRVSVYRWVLLGGVCLWLSLSGAVFIKTMWSQRLWRCARHNAVARSCNGVLWLDISVPAHWEIRPGQYVQLWLPRSKMPSFVQLPLFYVVYWENTKLNESSIKGRDSSGKVQTVRTLHLVTRPRPGLTARLAQDIYFAQNELKPPQSSISFPVHVLGSFGRPDRFDEYGTVLFVVEDIGLFRALSYIRQLVLGSRERKNKIRKLEVLWQVDQDERSNLGKHVYQFSVTPHVFLLTCGLQLSKTGFVVGSSTSSDLTIVTGGVSMYGCALRFLHCHAYNGTDLKFPNLLPWPPAE
jgi:hypothetical protein